MLAHTPLLCKCGLTGPLHISSKLLRPQICAAHSEYITSANAVPQRSLPDATQFFFFKMAHDKFAVMVKHQRIHVLAYYGKREKRVYTVPFIESHQTASQVVRRDRLEICSLWGCRFENWLRSIPFLASAYYRTLPHWSTPPILQNVCPPFLSSLHHRLYPRNSTIRYNSRNSYTNKKAAVTQHYELIVHLIHKQANGSLFCGTALRYIYLVNQGNHQPVNYRHMYSRLVSRRTGS
jgi:hypothetical protein